MYGVLCDCCDICVCIVVLCCGANSSGLWAVIDYFRFSYFTGDVRYGVKAGWPRFHCCILFSCLNWWLSIFIRSYRKSLVKPITVDPEKLAVPLVSLINLLQLSC